MKCRSASAAEYQTRISIYARACARYGYRKWVTRSTQARSPAGRREADPRARPVPPSIKLQTQNEIAGAAAPLGYHPPMDKDRIASRKSARESTTKTPQASASRSRRSRPPSSASAARDKLKNEIAGAAGSAATRQWIKTAIASAGNPREKARRRPLTSPAQAGRGEADPRARPAPPATN